MLGVTDKGTVTAMKKEGSGSLDASSVEDMLEVGVIFGFIIYCEIFLLFRNVQ